MYVCPVCYRPVRVKPNAKEGRCRRDRPRPKARRKAVTLDGTSNARA